MIFYLNFGRDSLLGDRYKTCKKAYLMGNKEGARIILCPLRFLYKEFLNLLPNQGHNPQHCHKRYSPVESALRK